MSEPTQDDLITLVEYQLANGLTLEIVAEYTSRIGVREEVTSPAVVRYLARVGPRTVYLMREAFEMLLATERTRAIDLIADSVDPNSDNPDGGALLKVFWDLEQLKPEIVDSFAQRLLAALTER